jgi:hypothetical protein
MNKIKAVAVTTCLTFLILSIIFITPIQAANNNPDKKILNLKNDLKIHKNSDGNLEIKTGNTKMVFEQISENHNKILTTDKKTGATTVIEIFGNETGKTVFVNGTQVANIPSTTSQIGQVPITQPTSTASSIGQQNRMQPMTADYFWWDGVYFIDKGLYTPPYSYPDRDFYYPCPPESEVIFIGNSLYHIQVDEYTSAIIEAAGAEAVGGIIGAIIGVMIGGFYGELLGTVAGIVMGIVMSFIYNWMFVDEAGCVWFWISQDFIQWLNDNAIWISMAAAFDPPVAIAGTLSAFYDCGYLKVGNTMFYDGIGIGDPDQSYYWVTGVLTTDIYGDANIDNPDNIRGNTYDEASAHMHAYDPGAHATIVGVMNGEIPPSDIYVYGRTSSGNTGHLYVYVSDDYSNWHLVNSLTLTNTSPTWIEVGSYAGTFHYITVTSYYASSSTCVYIDSVIALNQ